jgi:lipoprotein-releasing system permease protein
MMLSSYERMLARRYLLPGKGEAFITIVATFSLVAVTIGVMALIVITSVMNGFRAELFDKFVGLNGHAVVQGYNGRLDTWQQVMAQAKATPGVTSATPLIEQPLMASFNGRVKGILARGMRVDDIRGNPSLQGKTVAGDLAQVTPGSNTVAIGAQLADALGVQVGGQISLINPQGETTPFGTVPRIVSYRVAAIFKIGVYDFDNAFVIMPMADAQNLLLMGDAVGMIEVNTSDAEQVGPILAPLAKQVAGRAVITDWRTTNAALFDALRVDRVMVNIVVSLIILVAMFNIISSLIMLVRAKTRDIAVLRTMGASRNAVLRVFVAVGMVIGGLGTVAGLILGGLGIIFRQPIVNAAQVLSGQKLWDPSIRFLTEIPARTDPLEVGLIVGLTLLGCFLATLYPAFKAANTDPVQVLRYE